MRNATTATGIAIVVALCLWVVDGAPESSSMVERGGECPLHITFQFEDCPQLKARSRVILSVSGIPRDLGGRLSCEIASRTSGLQIVGGEPEPAVDIRTSSHSWPFEIRTEEPGPHEIRSIVRWEREEQSIEVGSRVRLFVSKDSVWTGETESVREELVDGGQRYRYAGECLVPIRKSARITQRQIQEKPFVSKRSPIECLAALDRDPQWKLSARVIVDEEGKVVDVHVIDGAPEGSRLCHQEIEAALRSWQYVPARARGTDHADWLLIDLLEDSIDE